MSTDTHKYPDLPPDMRRCYDNAMALKARAAQLRVGVVKIGDEFAPEGVEDVEPRLAWLDGDELDVFRTRMVMGVFVNCGIDIRYGMKGRRTKKNGALKDVAMKASGEVGIMSAAITGDVITPLLMRIAMLRKAAAKAAE
jgi:hypothetical protein